MKADFVPQDGIMVDQKGARAPEGTFATNVNRANLNPGMKCLFIILMSLMIASCDRSSTPLANDGASPTATSAKGAAISASPNPVLSGGNVGATTISWKTGNDHVGEVDVSENGGPEHLFATGAAGSKRAPWIQVRKSYEFRLYAKPAHDKVLAKVQVSHSK